MRNLSIAIGVALAFATLVGVWLFLHRNEHRDLAPRNEVVSTSENATKILFVGNSHTAENSLPQTIAALARARTPRELTFKDVLAGGATLTEHLVKGEAKRAILAERWDYVVLQEQGLEPTIAPRKFETAVRTFDALIKQVGAKTVILQLWPRRDQNQSERELDQSYHLVARATGATLIPAGPAWMRALKEKPTLPLYREDQYHPTTTGTYLAACVFVEMMFGEVPDGLPGLDMVAPEDLPVVQRACTLKP